MTDGTMKHKAPRKNPCKDCDKRPPDRGCGNHANCKEYAEWRSDYDREKAEMISEREKQKMLDEVSFSGMMRVKKSFSNKRAR